MLRRSDLGAAAEGFLRTRVIALVDRTRAASQRRADPSDTEALHDTRVALRRLRSVLSLHAEDLPRAARRKRRRALGALASDTNAARDAEVHLAWLEAHCPQQAWLMEEARDALARGRAHADPRLDATLPMLLDRLVRDLDSPDRASSRTLARSLSGALDPPLAEVRASLASTHDAHDAEALHRLRIAFKKLRYVLEPFATLSPRVKRLTRTLAALQGLLGSLHDLDTLQDWLAARVEHAAGASARARVLREAGAGGTPSDPRDPRDALREGSIAARTLRRHRTALLRRWRGPGTRRRMDALLRGLEAFRSGLERDERDHGGQHDAQDQRREQDDLPAHPR